MAKFGVMDWDDYIPGKTTQQEFDDVEADDPEEAGGMWLEDNWYHLADGNQLLSARLAVRDESGNVHDIKFDADYSPTFIVTDHKVNYGE